MKVLSDSDVCSTWLSMMPEVIGIVITESAGMIAASAMAKPRLPPCFLPAVRTTNGTPGAIAIRRMPVAIGGDNLNVSTTSQPTTGTMTKFAIRARASSPYSLNTASRFGMLTCKPAPKVSDTSITSATILSAAIYPPAKNRRRLFKIEASPGGRPHRDLRYGGSFIAARSIAFRPIRAGETARRRGT